jgi:hypothetical protein
MFHSTSGTVFRGNDRRVKPCIDGWMARGVALARLAGYVDGEYHRRLTNIDDILAIQAFA